MVASSHSWALGSWHMAGPMPCAVSVKYILGWKQHISYLIISFFYSHYMLIVFWLCIFTLWKVAPEKCKVTQAADFCSSHYISVDSVALEWKKVLNLPVFGFPEQLPAYLIMYNQKSSNRHTGGFWSEVFTLSRFLSFFFFFFDPSWDWEKSVNAQSVMVV